MSSDWLFEIGALKLALKDTTYGGAAYTGDVDPNSFEGITLRKDIDGNGLMAPGDLSFDIVNEDDVYDAASLEGQECTVRAVSDGAQIRVCKFRIKSAVEAYKTISCLCEDFLSAYLSGDHPNTKSPTEVWASDSDAESDDYCIPLIFGVAYIPVRSVNTGTERHYILGASGPTYTVYEVSDPRSYGSDVYPAISYTMSASVSGGYQLMQPIIMDSDSDGTADATGLWLQGASFLDMPCRYSRSDTVGYTGPEEVIQYALESMGVPAADIDASVFAAAGALYTSQSVGFDGGGWWTKTPKETAIPELLNHVDSYFSITDKVGLHQFSATPVETITVALKDSFKPEAISPVDTDSGRVHWPEATTKPMDILAGQAVVPTHAGGSEDNPSGTVLECRFFPGGSINAQKAGILYFQKKFEQKQRVRFSKVLTDLSNPSTLTPGQVVTVSGEMYGGSKNIIVTEMFIRRDFRVDFSGVVLNYLEDWGDLTTSGVTITTDTSGGQRLATTDYQGNIAASFQYLVDIPDRLSDSATLGTNITDEYIGIYDGSTFTQYFAATGDARIGVPDTGQGIAWNQGTGALTVVGNVTVTNPSSARTSLELGALATEDLVEAAKLGTTVISGGYILTSLLNVTDIISTGSILVVGQADLTANNTAYDTARVAGTTASTVATNASNGNYVYTNAGTLAYKSTISDSDVTSISGGKISTGTIYANSSTSYWNLNTGHMYFGASAFIYFGSYSGSNYIWGNTAQVRLQAGSYNLGATTSRIDFSTSSSTIYYAGGSFYPLSSGTVALGTGSSQFADVYSGGLVINFSRVYDTIDDLDTLHSIKIKEDGIMDGMSLPKQFTSHDRLKKQFKSQNGDRISDEELEKWLRDPEDIGGFLQLDAGEFLNLLEGGIRQLDRETSGVQYEQFEWLNALEKRLGALERKVNA